jgi:predicted negative regulator of RcsB-dependent stress response
MHRSAFAVLVSAALLATAPARAEDAYGAYARGVERAFAEGRNDALQLDLDALSERVTTGIPAKEQIRNGFVTGMKRSGVNQTLGKQLADSVKEGGSVKLLRVRDEKGGGRALFRVLGGSGVNYLDLHLEKGAGGKVKVVDGYVFISGETLSQSVRRFYLMAVAEADLSILDRLAGKEQEFLKNVPAMKEMQKAQGEKRYGDVIAAYEKLPPNLKKERMFLLPRFAAAAAMNDEKQYARAIDDFEKALPGDPALDLVSIDGHVLRKEWDKAIQRIDSLDSRVHDPFLEFLRGSMLLQKGDTAGAKARFGAAIQGDPTLQQPYFAAMEVAMKEKDWTSTADLLTAVERDAGVKLANLEQVDEFSGFVKSKAYKAWKAGRVKPAAAKPPASGKKK